MPLVPNDSVLTAIKNHFDESNVLKGLLTGGLWTGEVPEGQEMPYGSLEIEGTDYEWTMGPPDEAPYLERTRITFQFYVPGSLALTNIMDAFEQAFSWQEIVFERSEIVYVEPLHRRHKSSFERDINGDLVFIGALAYEFGIWRNPAN